MTMFRRCICEYEFPNLLLPYQYLINKVCAFNFVNKTSLLKKFVNQYLYKQNGCYNTHVYGFLETSTDESSASSLFLLKKVIQQQSNSSNNL